MAGFNKMYVVGGEGGFLGADGINPIYFQILVGDGNRQWLEVHYFDKKIKPMGKVKRFVPQRPDAPENILDACILFFPQHFKNCSMLEAVKRQLKDVEFIDFDLGTDAPREWNWLRQEAKPLLASLNIAEAQFVPWQLGN